MDKQQQKQQKHKQQHPHIVGRSKNIHPSPTRRSSSRLQNNNNNNNNNNQNNNSKYNNTNRLSMDKKLLLKSILENKPLVHHLHQVKIDQHLDVNSY